MTKFKKESFSRCEETCPAVTYAFETLLDALGEMVPTALLKDMRDAVSDCESYVKDNGTYKLRDALNDVCQELLDERGAKEDLERRLAQYE